MRSLGLRRQLLFALVAPAILVTAAMASFADLAVRRALEESLGERLTAIAQSAATIVEDRVLLLEKGDDDSRLAKSTIKKLEELRAATGVERILVVALDSSGTAQTQQTRVLVDSSAELEIAAEYPRARYDQVELAQVAQGNSAASVLFKGVEGRWYKTGYAPLREKTEDDREGAVKGAIVVNGPAAFFAVIDDLRRTLAAIAAIGFLALVLLAVISAREVTIPLSRLSKAAERIGGGDLETEIPVGGPREAAVLSETMRSMAQSIAARDKEMQLMLGGIAHEVRNPLGGIELFGGLLREDLEPTDPRRKHVDKILKEIGVLAQVVNDFLDYARRRPLDPKPTDVRDLFDEICAVASKDAADKKVALDSQAPASLTANIDRDEVRRAVLNLVKNAIQATPESGRVELRARKIDDQQTVVLEVRDTGPGVPEEKREEIFKPFFTTKQKGTGLGLALVKKTVDAHGGSISVGAAEGGGAHFVITLPNRAVDAGAIPAAPPRNQEPGLLG